MEKTCVDNNVKEQEGLSNDAYFQKEYNLFMPMGFVIMLVIEVSGVIVYSIRKNDRTREDTSVLSTILNVLR